MDAIFDTDDIVTITLILVATVLAVLLLHVLRMYARHRRHDLRKSREALDRHFDAMRLIMADKHVTDDTKRMMLQLSTTINLHAAARSVSRSIVRGQRPELSPERRRAFDRFFKEILELMATSERFAVAFRDAIEFGFAAMVIRWPDTECAMADVVVHEAEVRDDSAAVRDKAERVFAEVPERALSDQRAMAAA
jgi:hypothetical protein